MEVTKKVSTLLTFEQDLIWNQIQTEVVLFGCELASSNSAGKLVASPLALVRWEGKAKGGVM